MNKTGVDNEISLTTSQNNLYLHSDKCMRRWICDEEFHSAKVTYANVFANSPGARCAHPNMSPKLRLIGTASKGALGPRRGGWKGDPWQGQWPGAAAIAYPAAAGSG